METVRCEPIDGEERYTYYVKSPTVLIDVLMMFEESLRKTSIF